MATPVEVGNARAGLKRIIDDLQEEHTRCLKRKADLIQVGPDSGFNYQMRYELRLSHLEDKLEYIELLIRRYRGWLHD